MVEHPQPVRNRIRVRTTDTCGGNRNDSYRMANRRKAGTVIAYAARRKRPATDAGIQAGPRGDTPWTPIRRSSTTWVRGDR